MAINTGSTGRIPSIFISNLLLNRYDVQPLIDYLWSQNQAGVLIYYLGDIYTYPAAYNQCRLPPGFHVRGNRDSSGPVVSMVDTFQFDEGVYILHGHQPGPAGTSSYEYVQGWWEGQSRKRCVIEGRPRMKLAEAFRRTRRLPGKIPERLERLAEWARPEFGPEAHTLITGHFHIPFNSDNVPQLKDRLQSLRILSCGDGWRGQHITRESDGSFRFRWFDSFTCEDADS